MTEISSDTVASNVEMTTPEREGGDTSNLLGIGSQADLCEFEAILVWRVPGQPDSQGYTEKHCLKYIYHNQVAILQM